MRKLLSVVLALTMVLAAFAGCGAKPAEPAPAPAATPAPAAPAPAAPAATPAPAAPAAPAASALKGEITWWAFPTFSTTYKAGEYEQEMAKAFMAKNPDVKVKVEMIDFTSGPEKIVSAIQGGTAPDILFDAPGRIVDYGKNGKLASLDDMFTADFKKDVSNDNILGACSDGKTYWMYPISSAPFVMGVNTAILEKEGLMNLVPAATGERLWTTDQFTKMNEALKAKGYKNGIVFCSGQGGDQGTRAFISNLYGGAITDPGRTKYTINDEKGVKGMQYVADQVKAGNLENGVAFNGGEAIEQFVSGAVTTTLLWAPVNAKNNTPTMEASGVKALALPLPSDDGKPELEYLVNGFCVFDNKDANRIAISKEFIKFICDDPEWGPKNVKATNAFPVRTSFGDLYPGNADMAFYASMSKYYAPYYNTIDGFAAMRPAWFSNLQALMSGEKTGKVAADDFVTAANKAIADAAKK